MKKNKQFLYDYLNAYAPVAQETEGQTIWSDYIKPYCDFLKQDAYGTSYGVLKGRTGSRKSANKVVIDVFDLKKFSVIILDALMPV